MRKTLSGLMLLGTLLAGVAAAEPLPTDRFKLEIRDRGAVQALQSLADSTGLRIAYGSADLQGVMVNPVVGEMTYEAALRQMLAGTGLTFRSSGLTGEVVILPRAAAIRPLR